MKHLLLGVECLHSLDIIHRDLKPENILFSDFENLSSLRIADLGLAAHFEEWKIHKTTNEYAGTLIFMAPEQIDPNQPYSQGVDIFACGLILYILLTGKHPIYTSKLS